MAITLRIQDDSGSVEDANAYIDVDWFTAYHEERGNDISDFDEETIKLGIVRGKDYIDSGSLNSYKGEPSASDGGSAFPRYNLTDRAGNIVLGISLAVKKANAEYGFIGCSGPIAPTPAMDASGARVVQSSERVGPISESKTYANGGDYQRPEYPVADAILRAAGYIITGGTIIRG